MTTAILGFIFGGMLLPAAARGFDTPQLEPQQRLVRAIQFRKFSPVKPAEILRTLKEKGFPLQVERPLDREQVDRAQQAMESLLAQRGKRGYRVLVRVRDTNPQSVVLTFTALKN